MSEQPGKPHDPLYPRLLRLRAVHPNSWQRMLLVEGVIAVSMLLVLADVASAWTLLLLPLSLAAMVKLHDLIEVALRDAGRIGGAPGDPSPGDGD